MEMTHEERAAAIVAAWWDGPLSVSGSPVDDRKKLIDLIATGMAEASNEELYRRRAVDWCEQVGHFNRLMGAYISGKPATPPEDIVELRKELIREEMIELEDAWTANDLVDIADALADLIYVAIGCAGAYGIPLAKVFAEVHRSNLAKLGPDGKPVVREDGKIIKPEGWQKPDIARILREASCDR